MELEIPKIGFKRCKRPERGRRVGTSACGAAARVAGLRYYIKRRALRVRCGDIGDVLSVAFFGLFHVYVSKMSRVWWLAFLAANVCLSVFAQEGPLPLQLGGDGFSDSLVSARRQHLAKLLAELIERHSPLGLWTRLDEDISAESLSSGRRSPASWVSRNNAATRDSGGFNSRASISQDRGVSSRKWSDKPAVRVNIEDDEGVFYDTSDERAIHSHRDPGGVRESESKKILPGLYREPYPLNRGSKGVPREGSDYRSRVDDGPIKFLGDSGRASSSRGSNKRPKGDTRHSNVVHITTRRRDGVAIGNTPFQPGEDCDDETITDYDIDSSITDQGSGPVQPLNREQVRLPQNPIPLLSRPKIKPQVVKQAKVNGPSTVHPTIRQPSKILEPPYTTDTPSSTINTATPASTTASNVARSETVVLLIKSWQEETYESRQKMVFQIMPSKDEYDHDSYSIDDEILPDRIPETPHWSGSLKLRGILSVAVAGYNESYTMWYNGDTGESRLDFNNGTATCLRLRTPDGSYRLLSTERIELPEGSKRMCRIGSRAVLSANEVGPPALPDMKSFQFAGWLDDVEKAEVGATPEDRRVERWQRVVYLKERSYENQPDGEEQLTYRHEMIVVRRPRGIAPLRYSVTVDSSILGAASDIYMHKYTEFEEITPPQKEFNFDFDTQCDVQEEANVSDPEHRAALEPLKEFTEKSRGPLYRVLLVRYKTRFVRQYYNYDEEILRKNILLQKARFVAAVNRRGESFRLEINFLADRLRAELAQLYGAQSFPHGGDIAPPVPFAYERSSLRRRARKLPRAFDWREKGAITRVEFQGARCMSCWAFAVAGAIEGGLFARTGRKLALSRQCLIDCGHKTHANGCQGTWPKYAYEYVRQYGLPSNSSYEMYTAEKKTCKAKGLSQLVYIGGHVDVTNHSVNALKIAIFENGPVVVIIDATSKYFQTYKSGILKDPECKSQLHDMTHAVLAVGWGEYNGKTYFILKNSWSEAWGDSGYIKMFGFSNECGILNQPSYPLLPRLEEETTVNFPVEDDYLR